MGRGSKARLVLAAVWGIALLAMARSDGHAFQLNAVKMLAAMPASSRIDRMMQDVLASSKNVLVRIEAYRSLVQNESPLVISREVNDAFVLDRVPNGGEPLVFAILAGAYLLYAMLRPERF